MLKKLSWILIIVLAIILISVGIVTAENWIISMNFTRGQVENNLIFSALQTRVDDTVISAVTFSVSIVSMVIAALTYFSIDAVNQRTTLEGNYFENASYFVEYLPMVKKLHSLKHKSDKGMNKYFCKILRKSSKHDTFLELSRHIQSTIDSTIWLEFIDASDEELQEAMTSFLKRLLKDVHRIESLKSGLSFLLDENVKLIVAVFKGYTSIDFFFKEEAEGKNIFGKHFYDKYVKPRGYECRIEDVNGNMSKNPISRTVYLHNYSRYEINDIYQKCFNDSGAPEKIEDFFNFENSINVEANDAGTYITILNRIDNYIKKTDRAAGYNYLWKAVISETRAKIKFLLCRINNDADKESLQEYFGEVAKNYEDAYNVIKWEAKEGIISSKLRERQVAYENLKNSLCS